MCATAAIVIIGFTPDAVGNAEPSQTTSRETSHVSPVRVARRGRRRSAHPRGAHHVRGGVEHAVRLPAARVRLGEEAADAAGARLPDDGPRVRRDDALRAGSLEDARGAEEAGAQVPQVVAREPVARRRLAVAADDDLAASRSRTSGKIGARCGYRAREVEALARRPTGGRRRRTPGGSARSRSGRRTRRRAARAPPSTAPAAGPPTG